MEFRGYPVVLVLWKDDRASIIALSKRAQNVRYIVFLRAIGNDFAFLHARNLRNVKSCIESIRKLEKKTESRQRGEKHNE